MIRHYANRVLLNLGKKQLGYAVSLVIVTYNGWLMFSVLAGVALGHVLEIFLMYKLYTRAREYDVEDPLTRYP